jgi:hypothetical protein
MVPLAVRRRVARQGFTATCELAAVEDNESMLLQTSQICTRTHGVMSRKRELFSFLFFIPIKNFQAAELQFSQYRKGIRQEEKR